VIRVATDENFFDVVDATVGVVLVDFWKNECAPCARLAQILDGLVEKYPNVTFVKANVVDAPASAARFGVTGFPMVYILKDGIRITYFGGWMPEAVIADMLNEALK